MWLHLQDDPRLVPSLGCLAMLILDVDMVTNDERVELFAAPGEILSLPVVPDDGALLPLGGHVLPLLPGCEMANRSRYVILQRPAKHQLGRGEVGSRVRSVTVDEEAPGKLVIVQVTIRAEVVLDQSFGTLYTNFCSLIGPGKICGTDSLFKAPPRAELSHLCGGKN